MSSLTYAGAGITQLASAAAANNAGVVKQGTDIWRKLTPASGANTLAVTMSGNCASIALPWASFSGVDGTTPEGTASTATTGAVTPAGFTAGDATIAICAAENAANTMAAGQTQSANLNIHLIEDFQCVQEYSTATNSMTWTNATANPAASAVVIKQAATGTSDFSGSASVAARPGLGGVGPRMRRSFAQKYPDSPATPVELTQSPAAPFRPGRGPGRGPMLLHRNIVWPSAVFSPDVTLALTGVQATGSVGTLGVKLDQALTGSAATGSVGSLTPSTSLALTGVTGTGSVGTVAPSTDVAMTGVAGTASVGTLAPSNTVTLAGNEATVSIGTLTPDTSGDVTIALTGVSATAFVGDLIAIGSDSVAVVVQPSVSAGGAYSTPIQDRYWRQIEQRYKKKKKQAEKKSERAVELVEEIARRGDDLEESLLELKAELAEEHIRQSKVYVELLKLKLDLAEADEEEEEAATLLASEEYRL